MKKLAVIFSICFAVMAFAQDKKMGVMKSDNKATVLHGVVVDQMCAKSMAKKSDPMVRATKHDKDCALEEACAASGYGLFYDNGKWVKFDENGDKLAKAMFEGSKRDKDFTADVTGEMKGDKFAVASLAEAKADDAKKPGKKDQTHDAHK